MAINKVVYGNDTLIDLTEDTATADDVLNGKTFHLKNGVRATGNASIGDGSLIIKENATTVETFNANQTTDTTLTLGNLAFYNGDTLASGVDPISIGIDMVLLWTNADTTVDFPAQTISLDLSKYTMVLVVAKTVKNYTGDRVAWQNTIGIIGGDKTDMFWVLKVDVLYFYNRFFTATNNGITFEQGRQQYATGTTSNNGLMVPYKIYGIK